MMRSTAVCSNAFHEKPEAFGAFGGKDLAAALGTEP
jgi:hypothetical protein